MGSQLQMPACNFWAPNMAEIRQSQKQTSASPADMLDCATMQDTIRRIVGTDDSKLVINSGATARTTSGRPQPRTLLHQFKRCRHESPTP